MKKLLALAVLASLFATPAFADFTGKDAAAATITFKNPGTCTAVVCVPVFQLYDGTNVVSLTTAGADGVSNTLNGLPTYARMLQFNGTTWDRWQGAIKAAANAYAAGSLAIGAGVDGWNITEGVTTDAAVAAGATGSMSAKLRLMTTQLGTINTTLNAPMQQTGGSVTANAGTNLNTSALSTSANQTNKAQLTQLTDGTNAATTYTSYGTAPTGNVPGANVFVTNANANGRNTSGNSSPTVPTPALSTWHLIAANSTNATSVKGSAATLFSCQLGTIAGPAFLKIYNKATSPTVGTDVPVKTLIIPVAGTAANGAGSNITFGPGGLTLGTGFAAAVTGVITDADTTAVAAASTAINCDYE